MATRTPNVLVYCTAAVTTVFVGDPRFAGFMDQHGDQLGGHVGLYDFLARAGHIFAEAQMQASHRDLDNHFIYDRVDAFVDALYGASTVTEPDDHVMTRFAIRAQGGK
jgi:hypothetical protein